MSFLSILLVACAFYFAHARPDSQLWSEYGGFPANLGDTEVQDAPSVPSDSSVPITDPKDYQHKLFGFMQDVNKTVDQYMTPLMSKLDVMEQDELKSMGMNGFASYVNYLLLLIEEKENEKDKGDDQTQGDSLRRDEIILQFDYLLDPNTPFIADTQVKKEAHDE